MAMAGGRAERETATGGQGYRPNRKGKLKRERRAGKSDGNWQSGERRGEDSGDRRGWGCFPACLVWPRRGGVAVGGVAMVASGGVGGSADLII